MNYFLSSCFTAKKNITEKTPIKKGSQFGSLFQYYDGLILHHSTHSTATHWRHLWSVFLRISYYTFGSQQQGSN